VTYILEISQALIAIEKVPLEELVQWFHLNILNTSVICHM